MPTYMVMNKHHFRATFVEEPHYDANGNRYVLLQAGTPMRLDVGTLVDDVTPEELEAFPDKFRLVSEAEVAAIHAAADAAAAEPPPDAAVAAAEDAPPATARRGR